MVENKVPVPVWADFSLAQSQLVTLIDHCNMKSFHFIIMNMIF